VRDLKTNTVKAELSSALTGDIVSITTNKGYERSFGTWQLQATFRQINGKTYDQLIGINDVVLIEMDAGDGAGLVPVMLGLVDRTARTIAIAPDGTPHRLVRISGRDMGKLFTMQIGWDVSGARINTQHAFGVDDIQSSYIRRYALSSGAPRELTQQLYSIWSSQIEGNYYSQYVDDNWVTTDDDWKTFDPTLVGVRDTTFWDACMRVSNSPWNALFCETDLKGKFHLGLFPRPFRDDGKLDLNSFHEIDDRDIVIEDLGESDLERVNLLCLWPPNYRTLTNSQIDIALADKKLTNIDMDSVKANGVFPFVIQPTFVPKNFYLSDQSMLDDSDDAIKRSAIFWNWYRLNHTYESGSCQIHLRPEIRAGDGLLRTDSNMEYHIQQVTNTYIVFPQLQFVTTLALVRGQSHGPKARIANRTAIVVT
jgi:hypothetical protein